MLARMQRNRSLIHCWWGCKLVQPCLAVSLNTHPPTYQQLHFWVSVPEKMKIYIHTKTCMKLLTAASFPIAKNWKHPRCPSVGEWFNKLWHIHYSARIRNKLLTQATTWMNLQRIMLSEKNANPQRLCTLRSYLHNTIEMTEL